MAIHVPLVTVGNSGFPTCFARLRWVNFQIAAPEGFSACGSAPARTTPGVAGREAGLLVSIKAYQGSIGGNYAIIPMIGQSRAIHKEKPAVMPVSAHQ
ncbi:MAG: hypothetical protein FIA98_08755 [Anaerolineae bacterium]|nr:hypothetical protein [Anaerolineae bacterium]